MPTQVHRFLELRVQHQRQGLLRSLQPQVLGPGMQAAGAQLLAVTQDAGNALPQHPKRRRRLLQALDLQRWLGLHIKAPLHLAVGVHADAQRAGRHGLLQPRGDVDGQAAQAVVVFHPAAARHAASVDAHAGAEALEAMPGFDVITAPRCLGQQGQATVLRTLGVVFSGAGGAVRAEDRLEAVPA